MIGISIRPYAAADFDAVMEIWLTSWQSTGVDAPVTLAELRVRWSQELAKGWRVHVALVGTESKPEIAGFIGIKGDRVEQLFIAPCFQSRGLGKMLLDFAKREMPEGFHLDTAVDSRAPAFYEREGLRRGGISVHPRLGHRLVRYDWRP